MTAPTDRPAGFENVGNLDCDLTDDDHVVARADPLLETIAKALHTDDCFFYEWPYDECGEREAHEHSASVVLAALLSDAGSTQWGVRYPDATYQAESREAAEQGVERAATGAWFGYPKSQSTSLVRRQVLELRGPWEEA